MEERLPPSDAHDTAVAPAPDAAAEEAKLIAPLPLPPGYDTYVVQIPRDNVCRMPPPEHARIVEEHIKKAAAAKPPAKRRRRRFRCSIALPIFLIIVIAAVAYLTVRNTLFRPTKPAITLARIRSVNLTPPPPAAKGANSTHRPSTEPPAFKVSIHAENRNPWMFVSYVGGGAATLSFKDKLVGDGKLPAFINANDDGASNFTVTLAGKRVAALPKAMRDQLNGEQEKSMELTLDLVVDMTSYLRNERLKLQIYCDFRVRNSLSKDARITSQVCATGYH